MSDNADPFGDRPGKLSRRIRRMTEGVDGTDWATVEGALTRVVGLTLEAEGCRAPIGGRCRISDARGNLAEAEVVGFSGNSISLMPTHDIRGLAPGARVTPIDAVGFAGVGPALLGRVVDGGGAPLDDRGPVRIAERLPLNGSRINPIHRAPISQILDVGVRAINALVTVGRGQRSGIFAVSGVGKSALLGMMTRYTEADVIVVGLIGERGREVQEFIQNNLLARDIRRCVIVAAPADTPPLMRQNGALLATTIAEYFRDQGLNVLLLLDSLTRYAQAQREVALSVGELPATRGFPPSVFANIPMLVERAGTGPNGTGSITAFYTVLLGDEDDHDPVAECARAVLDGHIVLSRRLAESAHFPAIDIGGSVSRVMINIINDAHAANARQFREALATYTEHRDLINVGAYARGSDPKVDAAMELYPRLMKFLGQYINDPSDLNDSLGRLRALFDGGGEEATAADSPAENQQGMSRESTQISTSKQARSRATSASAQERASSV